jgi:hypothetical protein
MTTRREPELRVARGRSVNGIGVPGPCRSFVQASPRYRVRPVLVNLNQQVHAVGPLPRYLTLAEEGRYIAIQHLDVYAPGDVVVRHWTDSPPHGRPICRGDIRCKGLSIVAVGFGSCPRRQRLPCLVRSARDEKFEKVIGGRGRHGLIAGLRWAAACTEQQDGKEDASARRTHAFEDRPINSGPPPDIIGSPERTRPSRARKTT